MKRSFFTSQQSTSQLSLDSPLAGASQETILAQSVAFKRQRRIFFGQLRTIALALLYLAPALLIFAIFAYMPLFQAIWLSFHITDEVGNPVHLVGLRYYVSILTPGSGVDSYLASLVTSIEFALMVVVLQILLGLALAALVQGKIRGIGIFRTIYMCSIAVSLASASVIWSLVYDPSTGLLNWLTGLLHLAQPGLLNSSQTALPAVALVTVWSGLGFNFVILLAGMQAVPSELYESASLDGAGLWHTFRHITLPLLTPLLLFLLVVDTIQSFQSFTQFDVLMNGPGPDNATNVFVYATYQAFWSEHRYGFAAAMSVILFFILLGLSVLQLGFLGRRVHYR